MTVQTADSAAVAPRFSTETVTSKDGTVITYRQLGHGPGVVLLHGSMESAASHMGLAQALADAFTVYLPERRGHMQDVNRSTYSIQREVEDLDALLTKTDTHNVFGVSSGGLIALQAALTLPNLRKVAVYEPALIVNHSLSTDFLPRYDREIAEGKIAAALISGMLGGKLGPAFFSLLPRFLMESMTSNMLKKEDAAAKPGDFTMRRFAPTLHYDFVLVEEMAEKADTFKTLQTPVLLLNGSKSPAWLKLAIDTLEKTIPHAQRVEFPGLDHSGSSDPTPMSRTSRPEVVAEAMRSFFA
ncbi:MAG: alpha/beta fold hydrolase [Chloroflexi bacterium]|nr:alpha/beta fold hydrolase [Chloroflexota bacterium]